MGWASLNFTLAAAGGRPNVMAILCHGHFEDEQTEAQSSGSELRSQSLQVVGPLTLGQVVLKPLPTPMLSAWRKTQVDMIKTLASLSSSKANPLRYTPSLWHFIQEKRSCLPGHLRGRV